MSHDPPTINNRLINELFDCIFKYYIGISKIPKFQILKFPQQTENIRIGTHFNVGISQFQKTLNYEIPTFRSLEVSKIQNFEL